MSDGIERIERELARLGADREPPDGWQDRVLGAIAAERVEGALARLGAEHEPPPGWQARVLAAIEERPKRRWWAFALPAFAVAAIAIVLLFVLRPKRLELALKIDKRGEVVRLAPGERRAAIGDTLHAWASGGGAHRAVWVYRNEASLVIACPGPVGCREADGATIADLELALPGAYAIIAVTSKTPIPAPTGTYDTDKAALDRAKVDYRLDLLDVR